MEGRQRYSHHERMRRRSRASKTMSSSHHEPLYKPDKVDEANLSPEDARLLKLKRYLQEIEKMKREEIRNIHAAKNSKKAKLDRKYDRSGGEKALKKNNNRAKRHKFTIELLTTYNNILRNSIRKGPRKMTMKPNELSQEDLEKEYGSVEVIRENKQRMGMEMIELRQKLDREKRKKLVYRNVVDRIIELLHNKCRDTDLVIEALVLANRARKVHDPELFQFHENNEEDNNNNGNNDDKKDDEKRKSSGPGVIQWKYTGINGQLAILFTMLLMIMLMIMVTMGMKKDGNDGSGGAGDKKKDKKRTSKSKDKTKSRRNIYYEESDNEDNSRAQ